MTDSSARRVRLPCSRRRCLREVALVWRGGWARLRSRLWIVVVASVLGAGLVWNGGGTEPPVDAGLLDRVCLDTNETATRIADFVSDWTSDLTLCIPLSLALWTYGAACGRSRWRRLGIASLMATLMAGLLVTGVKQVVGRPRPYTTEAYPLHLYGPSLKAKLHSFPSGHTGTSTATGVTWIAAHPIMAVPGLAYAATVGWSRMQLRKHYPIDVAGGAVIGVVCGLCFASTVPGTRIRLTRARRRRRTNQ